MPEGQKSGGGGRPRRLPWSWRRAALAPAEEVHLLGVRISNVVKLEAVARMQALLERREERARTVFVVNAHTLNLACERPRYREILNAGDAVFGDGTGVRWAARMRGIRMVDNLVGTDLVPFFMMRTRTARHRYFLLGGRPEVVETAAAHVRRIFVGAELVGWHHGLLGPNDHDRVVRTINAACPDVLLVAMGNPHQEEWIHAHRDALLARLCIGVGGLVDHWGGSLTRAPHWVRYLGLEWLQILLQQPHKWRRYLLGNPAFLLRMARATDGAPTPEASWP
jgi:N-acetylglucosaminyldiphosphoundecaprenol N-acetyl-beta-D-mannosaminyltransferase